MMQINLDGTNSYDKVPGDYNTLTFNWIPPVGITLDNPNSPTPTFYVDERLEQTFTFNLQVTNTDNLTSSDNVVITIYPPCSNYQYTNNQTVTEQLFLKVDTGVLYQSNDIKTWSVAFGDGTYTGSFSKVFVANSVPFVKYSDPTGSYQSVIYKTDTWHESAHLSSNDPAVILDIVNIEYIAGVYVAVCSIYQTSPSIVLKTRVYTSSDLASWTQVQEVTGIYPSSVLVFNNNILIYGSSSIDSSTQVLYSNDLASWTQVTTTTTPTASYGNKVYGITGSSPTAGIAESLDGINWSDLTITGVPQNIIGICTNDTYGLLGLLSFDNGIIQSPDYGTTWQMFDSTGFPSHAQALISQQDTLILVTYTELYSYVSGTGWDKYFHGIQRGYFSIGPNMISLSNNSPSKSGTPLYTIPNSDVAYSGASATQPFVANEPYVLNIQGSNTTVTLNGHSRKYDFGGSTPFIDPSTGRSTMAQIQAWDPVFANTFSPVLPGNYNLNDALITNSGFPGRLDKRTFGTDTVTMVRYNANDGVTENHPRSQLVSFAVPPRTHTKWDLQFAFGQNDGTNDWVLTTTGSSPVLFWQLYSFNLSNPPLAMNVDTDSLDATKLQITIYQRVGTSTSPVLLGTIHGVSRYTMNSITIDAFLDERETAAGGKGVLQVWYNGSLVVEKLGPTLAPGTNTHWWDMSVYLWNNSAPYANTRAVFWKKAAMYVYPTAPLNTSNVSMVALGNCTVTSS